MARTLNLAVHTVRREAFVEAAQRLMTAKGYEQMSIQDVLDAVEASRGAFYHYFDSKQALLEAVIDRMVDQALGEVQSVVEDRSLPAPARLQRVFSTIGRWKTARKPLVLALLEVWMSDHNAIVREKLRRTMVGRLADLLAPIIQQGIDEGSFRADSASDTARVLVMLLLGFQDVATQLFLDRQAGRIELADVVRTFTGYTQSFERILGAPPGSIQLIDQAVLRAWFG
ncbi:MAG TPA: TetR/AcrR family transcriptional regulator [Candidatus Dormibacteraeota bacterium]|nr:TetR/AcrR family transcriptional regulator [Candidatus Dormibacteraeota bacterium]